MENSQSNTSQRRNQRRPRHGAGNRRPSPHYSRQYGGDSGYAQDGSHDTGYRLSATRRNIADQRIGKKTTPSCRREISSLRRAGSLEDVLDDNRQDPFAPPSLTNSPTKGRLIKGNKWSNDNVASLRQQSGNLSKSTENLLSAGRDETRTRSQARVKSPMRVKLTDRDQEQDNNNNPSTRRKAERLGDRGGEQENVTQPAMRRKGESLRRQKAVMKNSQSSTGDPDSDFTSSVTERNAAEVRQTDLGFRFLYPQEISAVECDLSRLQMQELHRIMTHNTAVMERRLSLMEENQAFLTWKCQCLVHYTIFVFTTRFVSFDSSSVSLQCGWNSRASPQRITYFLPNN